MRVAYQRRLTRSRLAVADGRFEAGFDDRDSPYAGDPRGPAGALVEKDRTDSASVEAADRYSQTCSRCQELIHWNWHFHQLFNFTSILILH